MRNFIDIVNNPFKQNLNESTTHKSILKEFLDTSTLTVNTVVAHLEHLLKEKLYRVGGPTRVYEIDGGGNGAVFVIGDTMMAVGIAWPNRAAGVRSIYVWHDFSINKAPNYCIDIPKVDFDDVAATVVKLIHNPRYGKITVTESKKYKNALNEGARVSAGEFVSMALKWAAEKGKDATRLTLADLQMIAHDNDTFVPGEIRARSDFKNPNSPRGLPWYNLAGTSMGGGQVDPAQVNKAISDILGDEVAPSMPQGNGEPEDPIWDTAANLAKAKLAMKMVAQGKLYVTGRKNGKFFRLPPELFGQLVAQVERLYARELADQNSEGKTSMETQYEDLAEKVRLVAGGKSNFIKSLLVTGAPSSGKSYNVMKIVKDELGLKPGEDYIIKKGYTTPTAMFRVLIEQCNGGLAIFDDCDSVIEPTRGRNMLKGALDTNPVREVSNDLKRGIVNTDVMKPGVRDEYVFRLSEILRGRKATSEDAKFFEEWVPYRIRTATKAEQKADKMRAEDLENENENEEDGGGSDDFSYDDNLTAVENKIIQYVKDNLPNKIDFKGRIIFISNLNEDEWDSAIISRAFTVNLNFESGEMLDFIDKIKDNIKTPGVSDELKQEVIDYIRELYSLGKIKSSINFRLVQQAFDYALIPNWKRLVKQL